MKKTNKVIATFGFSVLFALTLSFLGFPYVTAYHCNYSCPGVMFSWYLVSNFISDFLIWFMVGIVGIVLTLLGLGKIKLFETVTDEHPLTKEN